MSNYDPISEGPGFNSDKFRNVILFFIHNGDPQTLGKTKLMKLLYYADFDHYERHDQSITGATYWRLKEGPVAKDAFSVLESLHESGDIEIDKIDTPSFRRERYTANSAFDDSLFTIDELATLESVARTWLTVKMADIVAASHDDPPWNAVADFAEIPYYLVYYRNSYGEMALEDDEGDGADALMSEDEFFGGRQIYSMPAR